MEHKFRLKSEYSPKGDQPKAISELTSKIEHNKELVLLGATGTGKTFTIAHLINNIQKPTLVLAHNKTLAGQLYNEFKKLFPDNRVEYFVSNFDFYQPEAYLPKSDTFIDKTSKSNDEIELMRLSTINSLISRKDVIVVASVAAIYASQDPNEYKKHIVKISISQKLNQRDFYKSLVNIGYSRNDYDLGPGRFRVKGDIIEISPTKIDFSIVRISLFGNEIEDISIINDPINYPKKSIKKDEIILYPSDDYITSKSKILRATNDIRKELSLRVAEFNKEQKFIEAQRIEQRTRYDIEALEEFGICSGIENYARHIDNRLPGERPFTLIDYFPKDWLLIVDESHISLPQIRGMFNTDKSRKTTLIEYGFRLPSAIDNRPLNFTEFENLINKVVYVSATPGDYETSKNLPVIEQLIRPTGLLDPIIEMRPSVNQIEDIFFEIKNCIKKQERVFITTLTIRMSEELTNYLKLKNIKVAYLHSELKTLERLNILIKLRKGIYDVVVGVNLIREGIDIPEVALVIILDADKEGFLRNKRSLIQTIGRAARNSSGRVIMFADKYTASIDAAVNETKRRREIQNNFNLANGIIPKTIIKEINDFTSSEETENSLNSFLKNKKLTRKSREKLIEDLEKQMKQAAKNLDFERAAQIRDSLFEIKK